MQRRIACVSLGFVPKRQQGCSHDRQIVEESQLTKSACLARGLETETSAMRWMLQLVLVSSSFSIWIAKEARTSKGL